MQMNKFKSIPESIGNFAFEKFSDFQDWQNSALPELKRILGFDRLERTERKPIVPEFAWKRETEYGTVEKMYFSPEDGEKAGIYVCLPRNVPAPYKTFICLQGHSTGMHNSIAVEWKDEITPKEIEGDRDFAILCMKRGVAAICLEQRYLGERSWKADRTCGCVLPTLQNLMVGRTAIGDRCYDVDRLLDYLYTREDIDKNHLGILGNSGGGTTSMFAGALLPRITHVIASCCFSSFRGSIGSMNHCACNYIPGLLEYGESADVAGLTAPKPLVILNGRFDDIFPLDEADRQFVRLEKIYAAAEAKDRCVHAVGEGGHRFYDREAWEAMSPFFIEFNPRKC